MITVEGAQEILCLAKKLKEARGKLVVIDGPGCYFSIEIEAIGIPAGCRNHFSARDHEIGSVARDEVIRAIKCSITEEIADIERKLAALGAEVPK